MNAAKPDWLDELEPTTSGAVGRAWRVVVPDEARDWRSEGTVGQWIVCAPGYHPFWSWYAVGVLALRDIEGQDAPAIKHFPEAEYELLVVALDPEYPPPHPHRVGAERLRFLEPVNQCVQFGDVGGDGRANEILGLVVGAIVKGQLSPDDDHREAFEDIVLGTVDHYAGGVH